MVNPSSVITLIAARGGARMLFGFSPEPGDYALFVPPGVTLEPGALWDFACPVCHGDLKCADHERLCELVQVAGGERSKLLFSRVAGERATYVVRGEGGAVESLGEHSQRYDDTVRITRPKRGGTQ